MNKQQLAFYLNYFDKELIKMISEKYGFDEMKAFRKFINSETYRMLSNPDLDMYKFATGAILDMWECEQVTGEPRNSVYIRED